AFSALQSKKKGVRRIRFQDTDNNSDDVRAADFSAKDVSAIFPRSLASGEWGDELTSMIAEIETVRKTLPKFYETYCTTETVSALSGILGEIDEAVGNDADVETLAELKSRLEEAAGNVAFKHDSKIAQVYVATKKNESGDSYGTDPSTGLKKADGYVPAQMVVVGTDGKIMAQDLSWSGQIKVRGNSTSGYAKRPYNMKFSEKVNLFKFGKSKKWCLLADYLDPTLMRNKTALDLAEILGLDTAMAHQHVEVWVDGNYRGMYLLTEKIEEDKNRVNISTKNGDFLIETVVASENEAGNIYITVDSGQKFRLREPEPETEEEISEAVTRIKAEIDGFESVIASGEWDRIAESLDVDSFVSYYILNEYMRTYDIGWPKSVYFHCKDGKYRAGPGWDFDFSSGNTSGGTTAEGLFMDNKIYYKYLVKHTEFQLKVSEKLSSISSSLALLSGNANAEADFYAEAIERNNAVWTISSTTRSGFTKKLDATYAENLSFLTNWLSTRYDWMTDYFLARTYISSETFPDSALREYVKTFDTDSDSFLSTAEKSAVTSINLSGHSLTSLNLSGLEVFTQLVSLDVTGNPGLTWLNIAKFPNLNVIRDDSLALIDALPKFSGHSLVLSGQIGVDFYVEIPAGIDTRGAYAEFTINGKTGNPAMLSNAEYKGGNEYMFTCYINSIQMAESITATFHYGSDETITEEYRAKDYLDAALGGEGYSDELVNLVKAIKDFGHYVQPPLAHNNGWEIGVDYAEMDCADPEIDADSADVKGKLSDFAIVDESKGSGIKLVEMDLELNSETTINVYLNVSADYSGSVSAYLGESTENMAVKQNDGTYRITISGISAHMLGDVYTIHVDAGGEFDIEVSALSYANAVMNSKRADDELKKAVIALYKYYDATMEYRKSKPEEYGNN
ncbi:MAG: CotH kinase family protein, partial [Synergistaceae bacterium]|nr:CotH kinase family protein [Synergistaceae bacterium]